MTGRPSQRRLAYVLNSYQYGYGVRRPDSVRQQQEHACMDEGGSIRENQHRCEKLRMRGHAEQTERTEAACRAD